MKDDASDQRLLWHYTNATGLKGILEQRQLWLTHYAFLNDSNEITEAHEVISACLNEWLDEHQQLIESEATAMQMLRIGIPASLSNVSLYVGSLSEHGDLLSQWRAYCPSGGYAIGFDKETLSKIADSQGVLLVKCAYDQKDRKVALAPLMEELARMLESVRVNKCHKVMHAITRGPGFQPLFDAFPKIKHSSFFEEREWRLITRPSHYRYHPLFRVSNSFSNTLAPYITLNLTGEDDLIREIRIAPMAHRDMARRSLEMLLPRSTIISDSSIPYRN